MRVGLVFDVGGRGDKSFNDAAYEGVARSAAELGVQVELLEPTGAEDREAERAARREKRRAVREYKASLVGASA